MVLFLGGWMGPQIFPDQLGPPGEKPPLLQLAYFGGNISWPHCKCNILVHRKDLPYDPSDASDSWY